MRRRHACLILTSILVASLLYSSIWVAADGRAGHDNALKEVLIGDTNTFTNEKVPGIIQLLQNASQMAIDSNQSQKTLDQLREEVGGLPKSVEEFNGNGTGGPTHRNYTHRGWDYDYGNDDRAHWKDKRKEILLKTVNDVFDFGVLSGKLFWGYDERCNSLAALIYYVHIIHDHKTNQVFHKEYQEIPLIKGRHDQYGIIEELEKHCSVLFADVDDTKEFHVLMNDLKERKRSIQKVYSSRNDLFDEDKYEIYHNEANKLMENLERDIPKLLKMEKFFTKVFY